MPTLSQLMGSNFGAGGANNSPTSIGSNPYPRTPANPFGTPNGNIAPWMAGNYDPNRRIDVGNGPPGFNSPNMQARATRWNWMQDNGFQGQNGNPTAAYMNFMQGQRQQNSANMIAASQALGQQAIDAQGGPRNFGGTDQNGNYTTSAADLQNWANGLGANGTFMGKNVDASNPQVQALRNQYTNELNIRNGNGFDLNNPATQQAMRDAQNNIYQQYAETPFSRGWFKTQNAQGAVPLNTIYKPD